MEISNLAFFKGEPIFKSPRSTSNLIKPNKGKFLEYIKPSYLLGELQKQGNSIELFEKRMCDLHETKHCVAVCNGLWGLVLTIYCLKIEGKNEIVMPSLTYRRMADIAAWLDLTPHFCDVDKDSLGISRETASTCINENTAIILAPHPIVNLCDVTGLETLSKETRIPLLFDSVEASYAAHFGKSIGSFGDAECFSVHASKFLNGFEGGYITTNNDDLAKKLRLAINNGINSSEKLSFFGMNGKLSEMHASMTLACLDGLDKQIRHNKEIFYKYKELLRDCDDINLVEYSNEEKRGFKNILVELSDQWELTRDEVILIMHEENMIVRPYYFPPLHDKKTEYKTITGDMSNTNYLKERYMLLPCGEFVNTTDVEIIIDHLKFLFEKGKLIKRKLLKK